MLHVIHILHVSLDRLEWEDLGSVLVFSWICLVGFSKKKSEWKVQRLTPKMATCNPFWVGEVFMSFAKNGFRDEGSTRFISSVRDDGGLRRPLNFCGLRLDTCFKDLG